LYTTRMDATPARSREALIILVWDADRDMLIQRFPSASIYLLHKNGLTASKCFYVVFGVLCLMQM
jgi:hypothetical protein